MCPEIGRLRSLRHLRLANNQLKYLPAGECSVWGPSPDTALQLHLPRGQLWEPRVLHPALAGIALCIAPSVLQLEKSCALCACRVLNNAAEVGKMYLFNSFCHRIKKILNFFEKTENANDNCHYDKMMFLPIFHNRKDSGLSFLFFCPTAPISYFLKRHMSSSFAYGNLISL